MSKQELRAAAERLLSGGEPGKVYYGPCEHNSADVKAVARAVLAANPVDGGEAVTVDRLKAVGFKVATNDYWLTAEAASGGLHLNFTADLTLCHLVEDAAYEPYQSYVSLPVPATMDGVRRLASVLGIELTPLTVAPPFAAGPTS